MTRPFDPALDHLDTRLAAGARASGGWSYRPEAAQSRLEPTCWALLATGAASDRTHAAYVAGCQQADGWLIDGPGLPVNIAFNAIALLTWLREPDLVAIAARERLCLALLGEKGVRAPQSAYSRQDNTLQGWPWVDGTFSWLEPTAWSLMALKALRAQGLDRNSTVDARIEEAERLLADRVCRGGGWNFGNADMMGQDLRAYVATTAIGVLALQDRAGTAPLDESAAFLSAHWADEPAGLSMALALIALAVLGRPVAELEARLRAHATSAAPATNLHAVAAMRLALDPDRRQHVFAL